ncbi:MAG: MBL fold metallo-hydrolase [Chloroflexi bacterium]|nr:MBL fold metallo-hydrolase [Chloroflexota bacterium]MDA1145995.1 MBL fold metallo-hydrolase [Chloroflexota bacterium]
MGTIAERAERAWKGELEGHPWQGPNELERISDGVWFYHSFSNTVVFETADGLVMVDPGIRNRSELRFEAVRAALPGPLHTAIYTHGHVDHVFGVDHYEAEARGRGWAPPRVIGHEALTARFDRYRRTGGYNAIINSRQFRGGGTITPWPMEYRTPDLSYRDRVDVTVGGQRFELVHARGETDDATWVFAADRRVLCTGDLFVWVAPNAGNPQKVQRYAGEWAEALRAMAAREPEVLLPGHGPPIVGASRVRQALGDTAAYLEALERQTVALMNEGASLDRVLQEVGPPPELLERPYLQPVYDEPEFIIRNIWRLYGGWYDGQPSHLKPATEAAQGQEIARLAGGIEALIVRASEVAEAGDLRLACHLADWAFDAAPDDRAVRAVRGAIYARRAADERSTMAVGIYRATARDMGVALEDEPVFRSQQRKREP